MKICSKCGQESDRYYRDKRAADGFMSWCKDCHSAWRKANYQKNRTAELSKSVEWQRANREKARQYKKKWYENNQGEAWLKNRYGITLAEYNLILERQGGGCAICGKQRLPGGKRLAVDHCHDTGKVRGILCDLCNRGIGSFAHDPTRLKSAARYLR